MDGAWPASGISTENGKEHYVYDAYGGGTRSKLTFIIYLSHGRLMWARPLSVVPRRVEVNEFAPNMIGRHLPQRREENCPAKKRSTGTRGESIKLVGSGIVLR